MAVVISTNSAAAIPAPPPPAGANSAQIRHIAANFRRPTAVIPAKTGIQNAGGKARCFQTAPRPKSVFRPDLPPRPKLIFWIPAYAGMTAGE